MLGNAEGGGERLKTYGRSEMSFGIHPEFPQNNERSLQRSAVNFDGDDIRCHSTEATRAFSVVHRSAYAFAPDEGL